MPYHQNQVLQLLRQRQNEIGQELQRIQSLQGEHAKSTEDVSGNLQQAEDDLAKALLPAFSEPNLQQASKAIGLPYLATGLTRTMEQERQQLLARQAQIEQDPQYADREKLRDPTIGSLTHRQRELQTNLDALHQAIEKCAHPRLQELIDSGYGTDKNKVGFWRLSYYLNWKAADEIAERFPGKTWKQVREEYCSAREAEEPLRNTLQEVQAEIQAGANLEKEHDDVVQRLANLEQIHLQDARQRILTFLADTPDAVAGIAKQAPDLEMVAKRVSGLREKKGYLDGMATEKLDKPRQALLDEQARLETRIEKVMRPKNAGRVWSDDEVTAMLGGDPGARHEKVMQNFDKYEQQYQTVYVFNDYNQGSLLQDFLWWDLMTRNRYSGDYLPQVQTFRNEYPDYRYQPPEPNYGAAVPVSVGGEPSGVDVS
ncbi:MAG: hypothetical protein ACYCW6_01905 [Candidatus Xenobia bacterium]